ncbi:MAG TPA: inorganic diphosphatase [Paralcaligenes sp.]|jgi:inorganic pyrophosphatase
MSLDRVPAGAKLPDEFNVIVEIPMNSAPVKYEVDKKTSAIFVDRFLLSAMHYPCNYGYIPRTISNDGDPVDVLVISPFPIQIGAVIRCRSIGMLEMDDEAGGDAKLLALPIDKLYPPYRKIKAASDLPDEDLARIHHFFEHYKDLETGKWVKVKNWLGLDAAHKEIMDGVARYNKSLA